LPEQTLNRWSFVDFASYISYTKKKTDRINKSKGAGANGQPAMDLATFAGIK
jgi:hypothetical protein